MPSIPGRYEYDDDDLTPGKSKEGGLHQNLFDEDGHLKGSARFVPDDDSESDSDRSETVFVYLDEQHSHRSKEEEWAELLSQVVELTILITRAAPHAKRFWVQTARPIVRSRIDWVARRRTERRRRRGQAGPVVIGEAGAAPSEELAVAREVLETNMTSSEAQARYLLAIAARQISDEQMRMLASARIRSDENVLELGQALAELPPDRVVQVIAQLAADPSLLGSNTSIGRGKAVDVALVDRGAGEPDERRAP